MNPVHFSSKSAEWTTPQDLFDGLDAEFHFGLDAAADGTNAKCKCYFTERDDALREDCHWLGWPGAVWLNPPYGRGLNRWVAKAAATAKAGTTVVMLIPARPDTRYWAEHIWDHKHHRPHPGVEVRFLRGRLCFGGAKSGAPFPSAVVIFRPV